ncbi:DUF6518 family protein [Microlunatus soli]|uniref:Uncharacterized protein n=1 Tax=Microlunatus soli TaxID=630515 RepID=A0A1H1ZML5_9ACTN|nr:DUF6518 family protein [Microlunatus soli]SDT35041.1 hypothetical protein SAMN04489812_5330 [Microlunatus soli]
MIFAAGPRSPAQPRHPLLRGGLVLLLSLVLGGLTSFAQGMLPSWFSSVANSASGWTLLTAVLIWRVRLSWWLSAVLGAASFVLLTVGYAVVSTLRGAYYSPILFVVVGVLIGPFVGVAARWLWERRFRAAAGTAALAGIAIGDAGYGLTAVGDTTSPVYWIVIGAVGVALMVTMLSRTIRGGVPILVAVLGAVAVAAAYNVAFRLLGGTL